MKEVIELLPFVNWDRFTADDGETTMYGWIDRDTDLYKDFVVVFLYLEDATGFVTSSAKYSDEIAKILNLDDGHLECRRIENVVPELPNVIKISTTA